MTVIQELEQKAGQLPEFQRAALASKLLATLPPCSSTWTTAWLKPCAVMPI
jgi:hypothetical protein